MAGSTNFPLSHGDVDSPPYARSNASADAMRYLFVIILLAMTATQALGQTPTITPVPGQDCCQQQANPGCDDSACEACICVGDGIHNDPGCCGIAGQFPNKWDYQCSQEARGLYTVIVSCGASCACAVAFQTPTPSPPGPTQTPTITPVATATPTSDPYLCCDCGDTEDCVAPSQNVCPTPCVPVPNAICP